MCHVECHGAPQCTRPRYVSCPPGSSREKIRAYNSYLALKTSIARVDLLKEKDLTPTAVINDLYRSAEAMSLTPSDLGSAQNYRTPSPRRMGPVGVASPTHFEATAPGLITASWRDLTPPRGWSPMPTPPFAIGWHSRHHCTPPSSPPLRRRKTCLPPHDMQTRSKSRFTREPALVELDASGRNARSQQHRPRRRAVQSERRISKPAAPRRRRVKR